MVSGETFREYWRRVRAIERDFTTVIDAQSSIDLAAIVEMKLIVRRHRDMADVIELIRHNDLDATFADRLSPSLRRSFIACIEERHREDEADARLLGSPLHEEEGAMSEPGTPPDRPDDRPPPEDRERIADEPRRRPRDDRDDDRPRRRRDEYDDDRDYRRRPYEDSGLGGLIPYKNPKGLTAYYLGVFSLIPCLGLLLGPAALILGCMGVGYANQHPSAGGKGHAITGIVLGALTTLGNWGAILTGVGAAIFSSK